MSFPFITCAFVTAVSAVVSLGFSLAAVRKLTGEANTMALYACARSLALVVVSAVPFYTESLACLEAITSAMIIVQACDALIGVRIKDRMKTFGPAGTAIANFAALLYLLR